jgi:ELMO domain-containing protein
MLVALQLWKQLRPGESLRGNLTEQWTDIGFQTTDPSSDFRGMGMLGLHNLLHLAREFPLFARSLCRSYNSRDSLRYPPFAITGINLTSDCFSIVVRREAGQFFYSYGSYLAAFGDFFAWSFYEFDFAWREIDPPSVMAFQHVRSVFLRRFKEKLNSGNLVDVKALRKFS